MAHIKLIDGSKIEAMERKTHIDTLIEAATAPIITVNIITGRNSCAPTTIVITNILTIND